MEEARWQLLSQPHLAEFIRASNLQFFIVQINMSFKLPLMPGDQFTIETAFHSNTRKSITLEQILINDKGEKTNRAEVTFVLYDPALKKSVSLNEKMIQLFSS
jgi:YbgC/YbaW family acyl-CoA thioester hydrolase